MKKITRRNFLQTSALAGAAALVSGMSVAAGAAAPEAAVSAADVDEENCIEKVFKKKVNLPDKVDRSTLPRVLITTDLEVDDINGILLTLTYADQFDIAGLVSTAGMYHFEGDGVHTLGQITPHYKCQAGTMNGAVENASQLKEFRPAEPKILNRLVDVNYREDYPHLVENNPNYPSPDELLSVVKEGNVAFEGDVRYATEGSDWIKQCMLDDDPRLLYITHWGGFNTTARALLDIYDEYSNTPQWNEVLNKVVNKVRFMGSGEDNCREDTKVDELFPGLQASTAKNFFCYAQYFAAKLAPEKIRHFYQAEYLKDAFKFNHGRVLGEFHLMGDGQVLYGEPYIYQYGLQTYIDWKELYYQGYSTLESLAKRDRYDFDRYDWMCCQFTSNFIDIGLRQDVGNSNNHYVEVMFDELAARADWAIMDPSECNHAPVVSADQTDFTAKPGDVISMKGSAWDPDGDKLNVKWWVPMNACKYGDYTGEVINIPLVTIHIKEIVTDMPDLTVESKGYTAKFTVPTDAKVGDRFVVNMEVQDVADRPMTRFAQFVITVTA